MYNVVLVLHAACKMGDLEKVIFYFVLVNFI